jgi:hypothetical protein
VCCSTAQGVVIAQRSGLTLVTFGVVCSPLAIAMVLVELLSSFREPVVPSALFPGADFRVISAPAWYVRVLFCPRVLRAVLCVCCVLLCCAAL